VALLLSSGGLGRQGGEVAAAADSMLHKLRRRDKREGGHQEEGH